MNPDMPIYVGAVIAGGLIGLGIAAWIELSGRRRQRRAATPPRPDEPGKAGGAAR